MSYRQVINRLHYNAVMGNVLTNLMYIYIYVYIMKEETESEVGIDSLASEVTVFIRLQAETYAHLLRIRNWHQHATHLGI